MLLRRERPLLLVLPVLALGGLVATVLGAALLWRVLAHYWWDLEGPLKPAPTQPVQFTHSTHAGDLGIDCLFCHRNAAQGAAATVPAVEQCMFCHRVVNPGQRGMEQVSPEINKVVEAYNTGQPINWVRVHRVPDHVQFMHAPHIRAGFECSTCHGQVETMVKVAQVRPLSMGDCVNCHRQYNAPTDCAVCHY